MYLLTKYVLSKSGSRQGQLHYEVLGEAMHGPVPTTPVSWTAVRY
jgi:hypothetical protein